MKKITILSILLILAGGLVSAQTIQTERLYQKYRGEKGVISIWIPGVAMKLAASIADLEYEEEQFLRSIRSIRVLTIDDPSLFPDVNFTKEAQIEPGKNGYEVMVQVSDGKEDVLIMGREKNGKLKDLLVLVGGEDNVMVQIKGRLNSDMLASLAQIAGLEDVESLSQL